MSSRRARPYTTRQDPRARVSLAGVLASKGVLYRAGGSQVSWRAYDTVCLRDDILTVHLLNTLSDIRFLSDQPSVQGYNLQHIKVHPLEDEVKLYTEFKFEFGPRGGLDCFIYRDCP